MQINDYGKLCTMMYEQLHPTADPQELAFYLSYAKPGEQMLELLDITPKFCSDIELGCKGMSIPTLCRMASALRLTTDYILLGKTDAPADESLFLLLQSCTGREQEYAERLLKLFLTAMNTDAEPS